MDSTTINDIVEKNNYQFWKGFMTAGILIGLLLVIFGVIRVY